MQQKRSTVFSFLVAVLWLTVPAADALAAAPSAPPAGGQCALAAPQAPSIVPVELEPVFLSSCTAQATNCDLSCQGTSSCFAGLCSVRCDGTTQWCCDLSGMWCLNDGGFHPGPCAYCACILDGRSEEECATLVCGAPCQGC